MNVDSLVAWIFAPLAVIGVIGVIFFERKNSASTIAWVLVLVSLPILGFIAYSLFGSGFRLGKKKRYQLKAAYDALYDNYILKYLAVQHGPVHSRDSRHVRLQTYLKEQGNALLTTDNSVDLFIDGTALFERMKEDMRSAQNHIHLLYYIFRNDELGQEILAILTEKARNGVQVRLLYDSVGTIFASSRQFKELRRAGGEVAAFAPIFLSVSSHLRVNYRNHRKITVIDGNIGYVGGMNVGVEYIGRHKRLTPWRDTHMRLTGSSVWMLQERFLMDWCYTTDKQVQQMDIKMYFPLAEKIGDVGVQVVSCGPDASQSTIKAGILDIIYTAKKNIYLQTPYFAPDEGFIDALQIASRSGVDVRLMIPELSDNLLVHSATLNRIHQILPFGIKVFMYQGFIHSKLTVADGLVATVGTTNLDNRSFHLNFEVNAFVYDGSFALQCEQAFLEDQKNSFLLSEEWFAQKNKLTRMGYDLSVLLSPLI